MAKYLNANLGEMEFDGLVTGLNPAVIVGGGVIAALNSETTLKRGTILKKASNGKLSVYGGTGTVDCILCEDTVVGTSDVNAPVYVAGCFDPDKCVVADSYSLTTEDKDTLRTKNIYFKAPHAAD